MSLKEKVIEAVEHISEEDLPSVYSFIQDLEKKRRPQSSLMNRLKDIRIDLPADYAQNLDEYLYGEKRDENLR